MIDAQPQGTALDFKSLTARWIANVNGTCIAAGEQNKSLRPRRKCSNKSARVHLVWEIVAENWDLLYCIAASLFCSPASASRSRESGSRMLQYESRRL